jgi:hypothetical protein
MGYQPLYGKGQHALLWAGSPAESGEITINGISLMSQPTCCHTFYTVQLMHYSHFKTQSLQHLKPIKC